VVNPLPLATGLPPQHAAGAFSQAQRAGTGGDRPADRKANEIGEVQSRAAVSFAQAARHDASAYQ
jgi:hypothetical protein